MTTSGRHIDATGLVWQRSRHAEKIIGEVHRTRAGRFFVVMLGRRLSSGSLATFADACAVALASEPNEQSAQILAHILDPTSSWKETTS